MQNIIIEYMLHLIFCNESLSLMKHKQILVCYKQKVIFHAVCFPIACCLAIMLFFYDDFLEFKVCVLKDFHYLKRHPYALSDWYLP